ETRRRVRELLTGGRSVIVHAARGPDDPRLAEARGRLAQLGSEAERGRSLGRALAMLIRDAVRLGVGRVAIAGGDTCGYVARELGIESLSFVAPLAPGVPLCRARAATCETSIDGVEIAFKGGQVGGPDFFDRLRRGSGASERE